MIAVVYHFPCRDGAFAALAAHLKLESDGLKAKYIPYRHGSPLTLTDVEGCETVFLLDCIAQPDFSLLLAESGKQVIVLDHHKSNLDHLKEVEHEKLKNFSKIEKSGCQLALEYFEPTVSDDMRKICEYVGSIDLNVDWAGWDWNTKSFASGMQDMERSGVIDYDVNKEGVFDKLLSLRLNDILAKGGPILQEKEQYMKAIVSEAFVIDLDDFGQALAINLTQDKWYSEVGHALATASAKRGLLDCGVVIKSRLTSSGRQVLSLRSNGVFDTISFTKKYGGGGHPKASGCTVPVADLESWRLAAEQRTVLGRLWQAVIKWWAGLWGNTN